VVRHFGFWGALALSVVIAAAATAFIFASVVSGGVLDEVFWIFFWPLFFQVGVGGAAAATIVTIVGCLFNPSW
jgi:vacuolar-type H+-ATPase subunit I/STV1